MNIVIIDNYDSFTYNLHHYVEPLVENVDVIRNDKFDMDVIATYDGIILSPGPGLPCEAGLMPELIRLYHDRKPIFGVCLGHQALGEFFGAQLENLPQVIHGQSSDCVLMEYDPLFKECGDSIQIGHYHSWIISEKDFPLNDLKVTARNSEGYIMAIRHRTLPICGVQFHPESILTPMGKLMIRNWVESLGD